MKVIIKNQDGIKKVFVNGIDFDSMTIEFQLDVLTKVMDKNELKAMFLHTLKEKDFDISKSNDENGIVIELWRKEK